MKRRNMIAALLAALMVMMQMTPVMAFGETAELIPAADAVNASALMDEVTFEAAEEGFFEGEPAAAVSDAALLSAGTKKATSS